MRFGRTSLLLLFPAAIAVQGLFKLWFFSTHPLFDTVDIVFDDAYYYLGIAWNLANGHGSKFREPLSTNGYQPLWLLLLACGTYALALSKRGAVMLCLAATCSIQAGTSAALLFKPAPDRVNAVMLGVAYSCALVLHPFVFSKGLETVLLSLGLLIVPWALARDCLRERDAFSVAALFFVLFLARLDSAAWFLAYLAVTSLRGPRSFKHALRAALIFGALCALYFAWNAWCFGAPVPISGLAKALGNRPGENLGQTSRFLYESRYALGVLAAGWAIGALLRRRGLRSAAFEPEIAISAIALGVVASYYGLFSGWPLWDWYFWPCAMLFTFALARLLVLLRLAWMERALLGGAAALSAVAGALIALWLGVAARSLSRDAGAAQGLTAFVRERLLHRPAPPVVWSTFNQRGVQLIEQFLPRAAGRTILMGDRAGGLGYWMPEEFRLVQAEGLVADKAFLQARARGQALSFLRNIGIDYLVVDRERVLTGETADGLVYGIAEPPLALSMHIGTYLMCFPAQASLFSQDGANGAYLSRVFDFHLLMERCPAEIQSQYEALSNRYAGLYEFSFPSQERLYGRGWVLP